MDTTSITAANGWSEQRLARLAASRAAIDALDMELLELLNKRVAVSLSIGKLKAEAAKAAHLPCPMVFDAQRESALLNRLAEQNKALGGALTEVHIQAVWREILSASRALQQPFRAAYLGPEGTFSYYAGRDFLGGSALLEPCADFTGVFHKVHANQCHAGIVPLENSLHGTVGASFDLFARFNVHIEAEFYSRISHSLLSRETSLLDIQTIYSHPQPLGQCAQWLRSHVPHARLVNVESTAVAAHRAAGEAQSAAVGHVGLGQALGLTALAQGIEDDAANWTRFVLIARNNEKGLALPHLTEQPNKTSVLFTLRDRAGALSSVLSLLADAGINMRKLESRPMPGECWKYLFFADLECNMCAPEYTALREALYELCTSFRILGSYPAGPELDSTQQ